FRARKRKRKSTPGCSSSRYRKWPPRRPRQISFGRTFRGRTAPVFLRHCGWSQRRAGDAIYSKRVAALIMNIAVPTVAEDLPPRRAFTVADVHRMVEAGIIAEDERLELIGGEFFVMAAKGYAHELIKTALIRAIVQVAPADVSVGVE